MGGGRRAERGRWVVGEHGGSACPSGAGWAAGAAVGAPRRPPLAVGWPWGPREAEAGVECGQRQAPVVMTSTPSAGTLEFVGIGAQLCMLASLLFVWLAARLQLRRWRWVRPLRANQKESNAEYYSYSGTKREMTALRFVSCSFPLAYIT